MSVEFESFGKIPRLMKDIMLTEKLDGTNAQICITEDGEFLTGSRNRWITPEDDNFGFSKWANENKDELMKLGVGRHFGEWWGKGIQRGYGLNERRFSLFNAGRWTAEELPECCHVVPILYQGEFSSAEISVASKELKVNGSVASPGFMDPEGMIMYHKAANQIFKIPFDTQPKGK